MCECILGYDLFMLVFIGILLINDVEDFDVIWCFFGWINGEKLGFEFMEKFDVMGFMFVDKVFYLEVRDVVILMGIVWCKKKDVVVDLFDKLIVDLFV